MSANKKPRADMWKVNFPSRGLPTIRVISRVTEEQIALMRETFGDWPVYRLVQAVIGEWQEQKRRK